MESCGAAHYWARLAQSLGHKVIPIPPKQVKPLRVGQKTDANDAIALYSIFYIAYLLLPIVTVA